jgi:hypothetical protein
MPLGCSRSTYIMRMQHSTELMPLPTMKFTILCCVASCLKVCPDLPADSCEGTVSVVLPGYKTHCLCGLGRWQ